jgi:glyoxylase-like metal-dependent hydrolase (beta-lactamase superfamily II)
MSHVDPITVGRFEIRTICEGAAPLELAGEFPEVGVDWDQERAAYPWAFDGGDAWAWHVHAFVVDGPDGTLVVDTGVGPFGPYRPWSTSADAPWAAEDLAAVSNVVLTHLHADHAGGIEEGGEPRFPNATYHLHPSDLAFFADAGDDAYAAIAPARHLRSLGVLRTEGTDHEIVPGVRVVHTPGHTPGHRSVVVGEGDASLALTGDLLHLPVQIREREWFSAHDEDPLLGVASRRLFLWRAESERCLVGVSHFAAPFGRIHQGRWSRADPDPLG